MTNRNGIKYYKSNLGEKEAVNSVIRIMYDKDDIYHAVEESTGNKITITEAELKDKYTKLTPDGLMMESYVECDGLNDVIITVHKRNNTTFSGTPYMACRQNVVDVHAIAGGQNVNQMGVCITTENCPIGVEFKDILAYNELINGRISHVYLNDTLDDILALIDTKTADKTLRYNKMALEKKIRDEGGIVQLISGVCDNTRLLLESNDFMTAFHEMYDIIEVPFSLKFESTVPKRAIADIIAEFTRDVPKAVYITKYDKSIDLNTFKRKYMLMTASPRRARDDDRDIYIVGYDIDHEKTYAQFKYGGLDKMKEMLSNIGFS